MCYSSNSALPALAITYNHRSEAMYRAHARDPENAYVKKAMQSGLENVRMLSSSTPAEVRTVLCLMHNSYHEGLGETWCTLLDRAEELMNEWDEKNNGPGGSRLTTRSSQYDTFLDKFVFREKQAHWWGDSLNFFKITQILNNYFQRFNIKEKVREWTNTHMNFADCKLTNRCA